MKKLLLLISCFLFLFSFSLTEKNSNSKNLLFKEMKHQDIKLLEKYLLTLYLVKHYYVKDYNYSTLIEKSIKGLLNNNLDPHTMYLTDQKLKSFNNSTKGNYVGIGIVISKKNDSVKVMKVFDSGPSYGKLQPGDIFLKVNNTLVTNKLSLDDIVNLVKGKENTKVHITVYRPSKKKTLTFNITRKKIHINSVERKYIKEKPNYLYLKINEFNINEPSELGKYLKEYINDKNISDNDKAIILDLRNNPGGLLSSAIKTISMFIDNNKLALIIKGRKTGYVEKKYTYDVHLKVNKKIPLIILVNDNTASAAEVLSGVLQYYKRGIIIGEKTFGKGSVQILIPYKKLLKNKNDNTAIKLTVSKYYLPSGKSIQGIGILPDIKINKNVKIVKNNDNVTLEIKENLLTNSIKLNQKELVHYKKENNYSFILKGKNKESINSIYNDMYLFKTLDIINTLNFVKSIRNESK